MKSEQLKRLWKDRDKIVEGISNLVFIREEVERVANARATICQSNQCQHYDALGESPQAFLKGHPACSICGCNIKALTHSLHSQCSLHEIGQTPLWEAEMSQEEEDSIHD